MKNVKIRIANKGDCTKLNELLTKLIQDEKQYDKNINEEYVVHNLYERFVDIDGHILLVAESNNKIIGYLHGFLYKNKGAYLDIVTKLEGMFVEEQYRLNGIGEQLVAEFKKWSKSMDAKYVELSVCKNNKQARSLYKKVRFKDFKNTMIVRL